MDYLNDVLRGSGMLIFEVSGGNPNGSPLADGRPREDLSGRGIASAVSMKAKFRSILEDHESVCFKQLVDDLKLNPERFHVFESKLRGYSDVSQNEASNQAVALCKENRAAFFDRYWDIRDFGGTLLEENKGKKDDALRCVNTGPVTFSNAISVSAIRCVEEQLSKKAPLRDKDQDLAPGGLKYVEHGLYVATISVNPGIAHRTRTTQEDVNILKNLLPVMFQLTSSCSRPADTISVLHVWWRDHTKPNGSFNEPEFFKNLKPKRNGNNPLAPSLSLEDYTIPDGTQFGAVDLVKRGNY